jgi:hypothetical protein
MGLSLSHLLQVDPLVHLRELTPTNTFNSWKEVSETSLITIIKNFKESDSQDVNGVSSLVLKSVANQIATPLTHLLNTCLSKGVFPDELKIARTTPVYKNGDVSQLSNTRPISVLPVFSKVLETIMKQQLVTYFEKNNLLSDSQYGFRSGRSTTSALLSLVKTISEAFESNDYVHLSPCDLSKAFDVVPHVVLLAKLSRYGVGGTAFRFLTDYLSNRKQVVSLRGASSGTRDIRHGVPQGSVLGPALFKIMINDLILDRRTLFFADDET